MSGETVYDFVIVGSGFGGSVSALRLAEKGYSVAVLEAGKRYNSEDFPRTNWILRKFLWLPAMRCFGILRITPLADMLVLSGAGVGGGSLGYANTLLEPLDAFYQDPQWASMANWKAVLAPHFATARRMLGVTSLTEAGPADRYLADIAKEFGCEDSFRLQDVGVFFGEPEITVDDPYFDGRGPSRTGCNQCGGCMVGCRVGAKNTLDLNYLYLAEKLGATVFPETRVELIEEDPEGGYRLRTGRSTALLGHGRRTFRARQVVMAGGVLGSVELLLRCQEAGSLPRLSPCLGARVRSNSEALMGVTARNSDTNYSEGVAITSSFHPDAFTHVEPVRYPIGSDAMNFLSTLLTGKGSRWLRPLKWLATALRHPIDHLRVLWPIGWARRSVILLVMQTYDNSLRLRRRRRWWSPLRKVLVSSAEEGREPVPVSLTQAHAVTKALAERMDGVAQSSVSEVFMGMSTTAHILGGCAIGPDTEHGVVDGEGRAYGHPGLYVVDGSILPANLGANPSLTITALAEHIMSGIAGKPE